MKDLFSLEKLSQLLHVDVIYNDGEIIKVYSDAPYNNPAVVNNEFQKNLISCASKQSEPYIHRDDYMVYFACIKDEDAYYIVGPMSCEILDTVGLFNFYKQYDMGDVKLKRLKFMYFPDMFHTVELIAKVITGEEYSEKTLIKANHLSIEVDEATDDDDKRNFWMKLDEQEVYHHSYQDEMKLLYCVQEGQIDEALACTKDIDSCMGKMSKNEFRHWLYGSIAGITLCTRSAIQGGVAPSRAYLISDYYIQKLDTAQNVEELLQYRNHAVKDLTENVMFLKQSKKSSSYVDRCKDYIGKHYKEKIYLNDIADYLGISSSHLSRIFHEETGMRLQDFISAARVEQVKNLLLYSDYSLAEIAEYVNFPSQSYMGRVFKSLKGMTPKEYREKYKPKELSENIDKKSTNKSK
jgi:AraC-like DNA-binding protein